MNSTRRSRSRKRIEDLAVEYERGIDVAGRRQCVVQRGVVEVAQVAAEPHQRALVRSAGYVNGLAVQALHCGAVARSIGHSRDGPSTIGQLRASIYVNLTHHFLIAMPAMADPHFAHTLTYVCEHNQDGALGIVVNKPIDMTLSALFEQIDVPLADDALRVAPVHFGGPGASRPRLRAASSARQLAVHARHLATTWASPRRRTCSKRWAAATVPRDVFVSLGYAGWSAGQLEQELGAERVAHGRSRRRPRVHPARRAAPARGDAPARHRLLAPVRGCRARLVGDRATAARDRARIRLRHAAHRSCRRHYDHAQRASAHDDRRADGRRRAPRRWRA